MSKEELEEIEEWLQGDSMIGLQKKIIEHLLQEYKTLKEDFKEVNHECERLEEIDIIKDTQIQELQKKIKVNNIKDTISEKEILNFINEAETEFDKNYISKDKIREIIKKIENNSKMAEEEIEEKVIIAETDSLNFGRKEAHDADIILLKMLLKEDENYE